MIECYFVLAVGNVERRDLKAIPSIIDLFKFDSTEPFLKQKIVYEKHELDLFGCETPLIAYWPQNWIYSWGLKELDDYLKRAYPNEYTTPNFLGPVYIRKGDDGFSYLYHDTFY